MNHEVISTEKLAKQIQACVSDNFTGRLDIENTQILHSWSLHFYQGNLIWGTSSVHPIRRLHRQISLHCPQLPVSTVSDWGSDIPVAWHNNFLAKLVKQRKIQWDQMAAVVEGQITEILFDLLQELELQDHAKMPLTYRLVPKNTKDSTDSRLVLITTVHPWLQAQQAWKAWRTAGLAYYSPNLAPVIREAKKLQQQTSAAAYHNLVLLADGYWTLRDLAVNLKQNLFPLTQSIMPYIHERMIGLIEVEDFKQNFQSPEIGSQRRGSVPRHFAQRGALGSPGIGGGEFRGSQEVRLKEKPPEVLSSNTRRTFTDVSCDLPPQGSGSSVVDNQRATSGKVATDRKLAGEPKAVESEKKDMSPSSQTQAPISPLVACIDDNKNESLMMDRILSQSGYRFINIQDPVKALLILLEHKPDLIFLDLVMPIVNGYEICSQIRRISAFKDTPVIILTNNDGIVDRVRAKVVGASGFLAKPIEAQKVLKAVRKHLAARKPV